MDGVHTVEASGVKTAGKRHMILRLGVVVVACGLLLGALNSLANVFGSPYSPRSLRPGRGIFALEVLAAVLGTPGAWALTAFAASWVAGVVCALRWWAGPLVGITALLVADAAYYFCDDISGYAQGNLIEPLSWAALAIPVGALMGTLGALATRPETWSILPALAGPAVLAVLARRSGSDHIQPVPLVTTYVTAAVLGVFVLASWAVRLHRAKRIT